MIAALDLPSEENAEYLDTAAIHAGETLREGDGVELIDGRFLRILFISKDDAGTVTLHGIPIRRNANVDQRFSVRLGHYLKSWLPHQPGEVCAVLRTTTDADAIDAFMTRELLENVVRKKKISFTNTAFPCHSEPGTLVCRWKYIEKGDLRTKKVTQFQFRRITQTESDVDSGVSPFWLMARILPSETNALYLVTDRVYTYGDICAGGGGTARAAVLAGLKPLFLLDNDANACATLSINFGPEVVLEVDVGDLAQQPGGSLTVHVLHISFVCKPHSGFNRERTPNGMPCLLRLGTVLQIY